MMKIEGPSCVIDETGITDYAAMGTMRLAMPDWVAICRALYYQYENTSEPEWFKKYLMTIHEAILRGMPMDDIEDVRAAEGHMEMLYYDHESHWDEVRLRTNAQRLYKIVLNSIDDRMSPAYINGQLEILEDFICSDTYKDGKSDRKFKIYLDWENDRIHIRAVRKSTEEASFEDFDPMKDYNPLSPYASVWDFQNVLNRTIRTARQAGQKKRREKEESREIEEGGTNTHINNEEDILKEADESDDFLL